MTTDRLIGSLFLAFCLLMWFVIIPSEMASEEQEFYPRLTILCIALPAFLMILRRSGKRIGLGDLASYFSNMGNPSSIRLLVLVASYAICILCTEYIGFFVTNFVFFIFYMILLHERRLANILITPIFLLAAIYGVIVCALKYPLPDGLLF